MKNKILLLMIVGQLALVAGVTAQNVAINTTGTAPNAAAILDLTNTANLGLLIPRTTTATLPSSAPIGGAQGLLFYNTTTNAFNFNSSTTTTPSWVPLVTGTTTNTLTNSGNNTLISTVNSVSPTTAPLIITSNGLALATTFLTSTVNGVANSPALDLTPAITAVAWTLAGNNNTSASSFLGTTAAFDLIFKANSTDYMHIANATGYVGIGNAAPASTLDISGTFATTIIKPTAATSLIDNTGSVWYVSSGVTTLNFPTASVSNKHRRYIISNHSGAQITTGPYTQLSSGTAGITTLANNTAIEIISDGSAWLQIK